MLESLGVAITRHPDILTHSSLAQYGRWITADNRAGYGSGAYGASAQPSPEELEGRKRADRSGIGRNPPDVIGN